MPEKSDNFEELVRRNEGWLLPYLKRLLPIKEDAYDLMQEVLVRVWKRLRRGPLQYERAYLQTTAFNLFVDQYHATRRSATDELKEDPEGHLPSAEHTLIEREEQARFNARFAAAFAELNELTRACIALRLRGCSGEEIAETLGLDHTAVRSRLSRAGAHLRKHVGKLPAGIEWLKLPGEDDDDHKK